MMRKALVTLALALTSAACGGAQRDRETLSDSIRSYNEGVRWQRYGMAASSVPPKQRSKFVDEMDERSEDLRITDYEIVDVANDGPRAAKVHVKVSWYLDSVGTVHETHAVQNWEQHGKEWWMVDTVRLRGDEMPGLTERSTEAKTEADPAEVATDAAAASSRTPAPPASM